MEAHVSSPSGGQVCCVPCGTKPQIRARHDREIGCRKLRFVGQDLFDLKQQNAWLS
jgi:hypothetical protein